MKPTRSMRVCVLLLGALPATFLALYALFVTVVGFWAAVEERVLGGLLFGAWGLAGLVGTVALWLLVFGVDVRRLLPYLLLGSAALMPITINVFTPPIDTGDFPFMVAGVAPQLAVLIVVVAFARQRDARSPSLEIRAERPADAAGIHALTAAAFRDVPYASGDEPDIVDRLREAGALTVSLVATIDDGLVGHIAFSPATCADASDPWFALGPVSVLPANQRQGIGSALIERGLEIIEGQGALGCILVGDPGYYRRFGFELSPEHAPNEEYARYFMMRCFTTREPRGKFGFHEAFNGA